MLFCVVFNAEKGFCGVCITFPKDLMIIYFSHKQTTPIHHLHKFSSSFFQVHSVHSGNQTQPAYIFLSLFTTIPRVVYIDKEKKKKRKPI